MQIVMFPREERKIQSAPPVSLSGAVVIPVASTRFAAASGFSALGASSDTFQRSTWLPKTALSSASALQAPILKFGMLFCGVCPICLAAMEARKQYDQISTMKMPSSGVIKLQRGSGMEAIQGSASRAKGTKVRASIGNADGTRIQLLGLKDKMALQNSALPRHFATADASEYDVVASPSGYGLGVKNGIYKTVVKGIQLQPDKQTTAAYPTDAEDSDPPLLSDLFHKLDQKPRTFGVYHHINEGKAARDKGMSQPLLIGYTTVSQLQPRELFVASTRELPGFEDGGASAGAMMNVLGMAAEAQKTSVDASGRKGQFDSVVVQVEDWQKDLKEYLDILKTDHGFTVTELGATEMGGAYAGFKAEMNFPNENTKLLRIDLSPLKKLVEKPTAKMLLKPDTASSQLLQTINLPEASAEELARQQAEQVDPERLVNCPPVGKWQLFSRERVQTDLKPDVDETP